MPWPSLQEFCYSWNDWLQADTYLWVEQLVRTSSEAAWINTVTVQSTETVPGSWASKLEYSKAARAYAAENNVGVNAVTPELLAKHPLGVRGWSESFEGNPRAQPRPGGDGSNCKAPAAKKASDVQNKEPPAAQSSMPGAKRDNFEAFYMPDGSNKDSGDEPKPKKHKKGENSTGKKEREVKELLAAEQQSDNTMTIISADMLRDPTWWQWAKDAVSTYKDHRKEVLKLYADNPFFSSAKVAALSPKQTQRLRRDHKDDYLARLCEFCSNLGPKITLMAEASFQIEQMAAAKRSAADTLQKQRSGVQGKPKAKAQAGGKSKKGRKGQASAQSAQA